METKRLEQNVIRHYITKYVDAADGGRYAEAWLQLSVLGWCWCFSKRRIRIDGEGSPEGEPKG